MKDQPRWRRYSAGLYYFSSHGFHRYAPRVIKTYLNDRIDPTARGRAFWAWVIPEETQGLSLTLGEAKRQAEFAVSWIKALALKGDKK